MLTNLARSGVTGRAWRDSSALPKSSPPLDELCVNYTTTPDEARAFASQLKPLLPEGKEPLIAQIGPAVGTYTGPSAIGISLLRASSG